ncbi:MAG: hypothetical protein Q8S01_01190 [Ignavibacteria bacterium]|nr:hypothetical protein [Ignavibacteria bacterium]
MKKIMIMTAILACSLFAQSYKIEKVQGTVKALIGNSEQWVDVKEGTMVSSSTVLMTDKNALIVLSGRGIKFTLKPSAALSVNSLKRMTIDELLLALAMEEILSTPAKKKDDKSINTAIYGTNESGTKTAAVPTNLLGDLKLNGARQLAENGFKETAILTAKETYRKYPDTKKNILTRIYFAEQMMQLSLFDEALTEYSQIQNLPLNDPQTKEVHEKLDFLKKKLSGM